MNTLDIIYLTNQTIDSRWKLGKKSGPIYT